MPPPQHEVTRQEAHKLLLNEFSNPTLVRHGLILMKDKDIITPKVNKIFL